MKNHYKQYLFALLFATTFSYADAQEAGNDYVINLRNDTISCTLKAPLFGSVRYRTDNNSTAVNVDPAEIKEYKFAHDKYPLVSIILPNKTNREFLPRLEKGAICLYELQTNSSVYTGTATANYSNATWYIAKYPADTLFLLKSNTLVFGESKSERKKQFANLIADEPTVSARFAKANDFGFETIRQVIKQYNNFAAPANDHFVTNKNQTIKCKIVRSLSDSASKNRLSYRETVTRTFNNLDLDTVKEYTCNDSLFIKLKLPGDTALNFGYRSLHGRINLFEYKDTTEGKSLLAVKDNGLPVAVASEKGNKASRQAKNKAFCDLIADFQDLLDQFNNTADKGLQTIVTTAETYNKLKK